MIALIVEDNDTNFLLTKTILNREGWSVQQASSLSQFREALSKAKFDLVILDVSLPDGDGLTFLKTLRSEQVPIPPVFVMTAHAFNEFRERALSAGASGYFSKPFSLVEFQTSLRQLVQSAPSTDGFATT